MSDRDDAKDPPPGPQEQPESFEPTLKPEDQARVDAFLQRGVNSVERKPFRPLILLAILIVIVGGLSLFSQWLARDAGVF